jgi:hypothetical protein
MLILNKNHAGQSDKLKLSGITDPIIRENTRQLIENIQGYQTKSKLNEDFGIGLNPPTGLNQGIPTGGIGHGAYAPVTWAVARRAFPDLISNVLVGNHVMKTPAEQIFALRNIYLTNDKTKMVEAAWRAVGKFSGFTGSQPGREGPVDSGTAAAGTENPEHWKLGGDPDKFEKMPELGINMISQVVVAQKRQVGASISTDALEDLNSQHGIDGLQHLTRLLQYELSAEMDRETISHCKAHCIPQIINKSDTTLADNTGWVGRSSMERFSWIRTLIMRKANEIGTATRISAANVMVVSPDVATVLQAGNSQYFTAFNGTVDALKTTAEIGTLNGNIRCFVDRYQGGEHANGTEDTGEVLLAYKGSANDDAGVIFCPYIMDVVQTATDPTDFSPRVAVKARYAYADNILGSENYYRLLKFNKIFDDANLVF